MRRKNTGGGEVGGEMWKKKEGSPGRPDVAKKRQHERGAQQATEARPFSGAGRRGGQPKRDQGRLSPTVERAFSALQRAKVVSGLISSEENYWLSGLASKGTAARLGRPEGRHAHSMQP